MVLFLRIHTRYILFNYVRPQGTRLTLPDGIRQPTEICLYQAWLGLENQLIIITYLF